MIGDKREEVKDAVWLLGAFGHCPRSEHFVSLLTPHPALSPLRGEGILAVRV
jgi:hypothetical protein